MLWLGLGRKIALGICMLWIEVSHASAFLEGSPERYVVQPGDTLWGIAERFLKEPWQWQKIWIPPSSRKNPHLIYPGDVIYLTHQDGASRLALSSDSFDNSDGVIRLSPRIRVEPKQQAIPTLPTEVVGPFLNSNQVVTEGVFQNAPRIMAFDEPHLLVGQGVRVHVRGLCQREEKLFNFFRKGLVYQHPVSHKVLGVEAIATGTGELVGYDERQALATLSVLEQWLEILPGDYVAPREATPVSAYFMPRVPEGEAHGYVIGVTEGLQVGQFQIVTLTGGHDLGRVSGDVLKIYQKSQSRQFYFDPAGALKTGRFDAAQCPDALVDLPLNEVGYLMIFRVFQQVSYGLVLSTKRPIHLLDEVASP